MKKFLLLGVVILLATLILMPTGAVAQGNTTRVDVIIQTDGSAAALAQHIRSLGGTVNFQYRNVPAVAASIPADKLGAVSAFNGVSHVEKDRIVTLDDQFASPHPTAYAVQNVGSLKLTAVDPAAITGDALPEGYANFLYTGAAGIWGETGAGADTIVAVVDTGVTPNVCLQHAVIGAPGFPNGYNSSGDGIPATDTRNHWHGTHVGGVIASLCALDFSANPGDPLYQAVAAYLPWDPDFVPIYGQAPLAQLYPVKVFPSTGAGVPSSVVLDGLDHVLTLKKTGALDVDIVNLSLGGPTLWDGRDAYDRFMKELTHAGILVVAAAGNDGPIPNSIGSPGTAFDSISVAALDYAASSRVLYEFIGLTRGLGAGQGLVMRPSGETRIVNYSSRGPMSDGRGGPDISALGHWNFQAGPNNELRWAGGTSFASPTVAGVAALLNSYWENQGLETHPFAFRSALLRGANPNVVPTWQRSVKNQGWGVLDAPAALNRLKTQPAAPAPTPYTGVLQPNVLPAPAPNQVAAWQSGQVTLQPSQNYDVVFAVNEYTSKVTIEVFDVVAPNNSAYAFWPNALEVHVQSAKRTAFSHPVEVYWYPYFYGNAFDIVIEDGPWTFWDIPWDYQPMEPGLMKLSLIGDYSNEAMVSFKVRVTRENLRTPLANPVFSSFIEMGDSFVVPVNVPAGTDAATFDLTWVRDWREFPTSDIDMILFDPAFNLVTFDGATGNAPERAIVDNPAPGTWYVLVDAYEVNRRDLFNLFVTTE
jgi:hypothetical protein